MSQPSAVRHINQSRILQALLHNGPMTRADIARDLKMMRSTAGNIVAALLDEGLVREIGDLAAGVPEARGVGRPGTRVELNPGHSHFLGADVGVGYLRLAIYDLAARKVGSRVRLIEADRQDPAATAALLAGEVEALIADAAVPADSIRGLCVSVPGLIDRNGRVRRAPILHWRDVPFLDMVRDRLPQLPRIEGENDANAFARAELAGRRQEPPDTLFLWLDAGVGGAIFAAGQLLRGHHGYAGEFGHIFAGPNDMAGDTPLANSLESFIGRDATLARNRALGGSATDIAALLAEIDAGRASARQLLDSWTTVLARGLATLTSIFDPSAIVIGGALAPVLERCLDDTLERFRLQLVDGTPMPDIRVSRQGPDGAAAGCALILHRSFLDIDRDFVFGTSAGSDHGR